MERRTRRKHNMTTYTLTLGGTQELVDQLVEDQRRLDNGEATVNEIRDKYATDFCGVLVLTVDEA